jgi:hypothetical protein
MADALAASLVMHGARDAIAGGMMHIEEQVKGIEQAVNENPGLAFDLAKTLIESACRTILTERGIPFDQDDDTPRLFRTVTNSLTFLPPEASGETNIRRKLEQTLNGLNTAVQGVCELRNACGFASHGSGQPRPTMESVQALLAAEAADAIVGFLYRVHRQDLFKAKTLRLNYEDYGEFNAFVDEIHESMRIFEEEFMPSKILFEMGPEPYRVHLGDFFADKQSAEGDAAQDNTIGSQQ